MTDRPDSGRSAYYAALTLFFDPAAPTADRSTRVQAPGCRSRRGVLCVVRCSTGRQRHQGAARRPVPGGPVWTCARQPAPLRTGPASGSPPAVLRVDRAAAASPARPSGHSARRRTPAGRPSRRRGWARHPAQHLPMAGRSPTLSPTSGWCCLHSAPFMVVTGGPQPWRSAAHGLLGGERGAVVRSSTEAGRPLGRPAARPRRPAPRRAAPRGTRQGTPGARPRPPAQFPAPAARGPSGSRACARPGWRTGPYLVSENQKMKTREWDPAERDPGACTGWWQCDFGPALREGPPTPSARRSLVPSSSGTLGPLGRRPFALLLHELSGKAPLSST